MRSVLGELLAHGDGRGDVLVDMEAGLEHLSRGTTRHVDALLAVAEPYYRSLETARRVCELASELEIATVGVAANKLRDAGDAAAIRDYCDRHGLRILGEVPHDDAVVEADRRAAALLDVANPDAPAAAAIDRLADGLLNGKP